MMIDWFVLLTPLILLPIVLLLVFLGCTLDTEGAADTRISVTFHYPDGLDEVQLIEGTIVAELAGAETFPTPGEFKREGKEIDPGGEDIPVNAGVRIEDFGTITCNCTVTKKPAEQGQSGEQLPLDPLSKAKIMGDEPPLFELVRNGSGFFIE